MDEIHFSEIAPFLGDCFILLKKPFLEKLLASISPHKKAYMDKAIVETAGYSLNKQKRRSPGLYSAFKGEKSIRIKNLKKILKLSSYCWKDAEENLVYLKSWAATGLDDPKISNCG